MLIRIEDDILLEAQKGNQQVLTVLNSLSMSQRKQKIRHILTGSFSTIKGLAFLDRLGSSERQVFMSIFKKLSGLGALYSSIPFCCKVTTLRSTEMAQNCIYINPNTHASFEFDHDVKLLVENLNDAEVLGYVLFYFKEQHSILKEIPCSYDEWMGGGDTTYQNFDKAIADRRYFCLSILDGDKKYDSDCAPYGDTYKKVKNRGDKEKPFNCQYYGTVKLREIENAIPFKVFSEDSNYRHHSIISSKMRFDMSFFDFKEGLKYKDINNDFISEYWIRVLSEYPDVVKEINLCEQYRNLCKNCNDYKKDCGDLVLIEGFGSKLLAYILKEHKEKLKCIGNYCPSDSQKYEWNIIGSLIFNWTCASLPLPKISFM